MFKSDLGKARSKLQSVRQDLENARGRWDELKKLPPPPEEIVARLMHVLDRRAAGYEQMIRQRLASIAPDCARPEDTPGLQISMMLLQNPGQYQGQEIEGLLVFIFRAQIEAALLKAVRAAKLKCGPPAADRAAELDRLDVQIKQLEEQEAAIVAEFNSLRGELQ
jgi:hypothetical protein